MTEDGWEPGRPIQEKGQRRVKRRIDPLGLGPTREEVLAEHTQCQFYLERKHRFCNQARVGGDSLFCGVHGEQVRKRIPCPVDPSHTIYEDKVAQHVLICNAAKQQMALEAETWFCLNCNSGTSIPSSASDNQVIVDPDALLAKINSCWAALGEQISVRPAPLEGEETESERRMTETVIQAVAQGQSSFKQLRHAKQDAKIVLEMSKADLLHESATIYVELGAGRGVLGHSVSSVAPNAKLVLVERAGQRHKADTQLRAEGASQFTRLRTDIRHVLLRGLPGLGQGSDCHHVVVIAKHLCGVATDLALRSMEALPSDATAPRAGLSIATCCHHACVWEDYVGREWLAAQGFTAAEFNVLKYWSGWAFALKGSGSRGRDDEKEKEEEEEEEEHKAPKDNANRPTNITREEMAACGAKIKRLLDHGRLLYARSRLQMPSVRVVQYCDSSESPECFLLVGQR